MMSLPAPEQPLPPPTGGEHADPLIDEVREVRRRLSDKHGNDVGRLVEALREIERREKARGRRFIDPARLRERPQSA